MNINGKIKAIRKELAFLKGRTVEAIYGQPRLEWPNVEGDYSGLELLLGGFPDNCGIQVMSNFDMDSGDLAECLYPFSPDQRFLIRLASVEVVKLAAWQRNCSILFATLNDFQTEVWEPVLLKSEFQRHHKLKNRNSGRVISTYSCNLLEWK